MLEINRIQFMLFVNLGLFSAGLILILIFSRKALFLSLDFKRILALIMLGVGLIYFFQITNKLVEQNALNEKNSMLWGQPMAISQLPDGNFVVAHVLGQKLYVVVSKFDSSKTIVFNDLKITDQLPAGTEFTKKEDVIIFIPIKYWM